MIRQCGLAPAIHIECWVGKWRMDVSRTGPGIAPGPVYNLEWPLPDHEVPHHRALNLTPLPACSFPAGTKGFKVDIHYLFTLASEHLSDCILQGSERHRDKGGGSTEYYHITGTG